MLTIFWYIFLVFILTTPLVWILENNGSIVINWLGYEIQTDILTALLICAFSLTLVALISYILTRLLAIKFPQLLRLLFKKATPKNLNKLFQITIAVSKLYQNYYWLSRSMILKALKNSQRFLKQIKYKNLNNFLEQNLRLKKAILPLRKNIFHNIKIINMLKFYY